MGYYNEMVDIRGDGRIVLYKRQNRKGEISPTWFMRISLPLSESKGYFKSTTKETLQGLASKVALDKFDSLYAKVKGGGSLTSFPFSKLFKEWSTYWMETSSQNLEKDKRAKVNFIGGYPLKFFTKVLKDIDVNEIKDIHILDYKVYRKQNSSLKGVKFIPKASTINGEISTLSLMFEYGYTKGYINKKPILKREPADNNRRPTFTLDEYNILTKGMRERVKSSPLTVKRDRFYLQHLVLILTNTGCRLGEIKTCKWENLRTKDYDGEKRLILSIDGKTGKRDVISNKGTETYIKRLYDYRSEQLGRAPDNSEYIICHSDGQPIGSFKKSFRALLDSLNLTKNSFGETRTLYSLRHFFATMRLEAEVNPYLLAQNMGTSIEMLRKFYGQIVTERVAIELTKTKEKITVKKSENDYPFD